MPKSYDIVIVGAGPAGLMAAKTAGESGLRIALLERKKDITNVRRTDGGVVALINAVSKCKMTNSSVLTTGSVIS